VVQTFHPYQPKHPTPLARCDLMIVEPWRHWNVFKQIFADHWDVFQQSHPRYNTGVTVQSVQIVPVSLSFEINDLYRN
jgi:hypothetical protein